MDDIITLEKGQNKLVYDVCADKTFGTQIINLTAGATLDVNIMAEEGADVNNCFTTLSGNDYVVEIYGSVLRREEDYRGKLVFKNFAKKATVDGLNINIYKNNIIKTYTFDLINETFTDYTESPSKQYDAYSLTYDADNNEAFLNKALFTGTRLSEFVDASEFDVMTIGKGKGMNINMGDGDNKVIGSLSNDTIKTGSGHDVVVVSDGNDVITLGKGDNEIYLDASKSFDKQTINLTSSEKLNINITAFNDIDKTKLSDYFMTSVNGNDFVITVYKDCLRKEKQGQLVLKNFAKNDMIGKDGSLFVNVFDANGTLLFVHDLKNEERQIGAGGFEHVASVIYDADNHEEFLEKKSFTGTRLSEYVDASKFKVLTIGEGKGMNINVGEGDNEVIGSDGNDTIKAGSGDDAVIVSEGNDLITLGKGDNEIIIDASKQFGTQTINLTKEEKLTVSVIAYQGWDPSDTDTFFNEVRGNDLVISMFKSSSRTVEDKLGELVLKNFAKTQTLDELYINVYEHGTTELDFNNALVSYNLAQQTGGSGGLMPSIPMVVYDERNNEQFMDKASFTGTRLNETVDASTYIVHTEGKNKGKGMNINMGDGINSITGTKGSDTIKAGKDSDTLYITESIDDDTIDVNDVITLGKGENRIVLDVTDNKKFGTQTINLTTGEKLNINVKAGDNYSFSDANFLAKVKGNDYVIEVYSSPWYYTQEKYLGEFVFKNFVSKDYADELKINIYDVLTEPGIEILNYEWDILNDKLTDYFSYPDHPYSEYAPDLIYDSNHNKDVLRQPLFKGTRLSEKIDGTAFKPKDEQPDRGMNVNAGDGDNYIISSGGDDTIKAGSGNDTFEYMHSGFYPSSHEDNDVITLGGGSNKIIYNNRKVGLDNINLTKGEKLTIDIQEAYKEPVPVPRPTYKAYTDGKNVTFEFNDEEEAYSYKAGCVVNGYAKGSKSVAESVDLTYKYYDGENVETTTTNLDDLTYNVIPTAKYTGSRLHEYINLSDESYSTTTNINMGDGNNTIYGSKGSDVIKAGKDSDTLYITERVDDDTIDVNDVITLGKGENKIIVDLTDNKKFGMQTINLTAGEKLNIDISVPVDSSASALKNCVTSLKGNDFVIDILAVGSGEQLGTFVLKNFAKKATSEELNINIYEGTNKTYTYNLIDETVNGNSVPSIIYDETYNSDFLEKGTFTGTRLAEKIDASTYIVAEEGKNKGKGVNINAGDGYNVIIGSVGADTIKAGSGNDEYEAKVSAEENDNDLITLGAGSNKIIYRDNKTGIDRVTLSKGEKLNIDFSQTMDDSIVATTDGINVTFGFNDDSSIIVNNYAKNFVADEVTMTDSNGEHNLENLEYVVNNVSSKYTGSRLHERIEWGDATKALNINAGDGNNTIQGGSGNDTIKAGNGNDSIIASDGNDNYTLGLGNDTITYVAGSTGSDVVNFTKAGKDQTAEILNVNDLVYDKLEVLGNDIVVSNEGQNLITFRNLAKYNDIADVKLNSKDIFGITTKINIDATKGGTVLSTKGNDVITVGGNKSVTINETKGNDEINIPTNSYAKITFNTLDKISDAWLEFNHVGRPDASYNVLLRDDNDKHHSDYGKTRINNIADLSRLTIVEGKDKYVTSVYAPTVEQTNIELSNKVNNFAFIVSDDAVNSYSVRDTKNNDVIFTQNDRSEPEELQNRTFEYTGGNDRYYTGEANDSYNINIWNNKTSLVVSDISKGNNQLSFTDPNGDYSNMKLIFDVKNDGTIGADLMFAQGTTTDIAKQYIAGNGPAGVVVENSIDINNSGTVDDTTDDFVEFTFGGVDIKGREMSDIDTKLNTIRNDVAAWLTNTGHNSAFEVFDSNDKAAINDLMLVYSNGMMP